MKRFQLAVPVLLLSLLLIPRVQGIRLGTVLENSVDRNSRELPKSVRHQGKDRKLLTAPTTATTATSPTDQKAHDQDVESNEAASEVGAKEGFLVKSSTTELEHYPDIIDIAGMDYSPATRKPPIHN